MQLKQHATRIEQESASRDLGLVKSVLVQAAQQVQWSLMIANEATLVVAILDRTNQLRQSARLVAFDSLTVAADVQTT